MDGIQKEPKLEYYQSVFAARDIVALFDSHERVKLILDISLNALPEKGKEAIYVLLKLRKNEQVSKKYVL